MLATVFLESGLELRNRCVTGITSIDAQDM